MKMAAIFTGATLPTTAMTQTHPITPPPELVQQWRHSWLPSHGEFVDYMTTRAAQWAADQELEACCEWVGQWCGRWPDGTRPEGELLAARRPKPPSVKEEAFKALGPEPLPVTAPMGDTILNKNIIERHRLLHRALEALPND
jgi:hypothetical protein